jgi:transposase-like protein
MPAGQTVDFYLSETRDREAAKIFLESDAPACREAIRARN